MCQLFQADTLTLIFDCVRDIEAGERGWFYIRECFGGVSAGWNPEPLPDLPGVIWSRLASESK
jgi:hypothetical protein